MARNLTGRRRRKLRIRKKVFGIADRPRLSVFRSLKNIGAQLIDDINGRTLVAASTYEASLRKKGGTGNCTAAEAVGEAIALRAKEKGIERVVFDRNGCLYHGRVKALADAAREKGLKF